MNEYDKIDKGSTDGMFIQTSTGKKLTKEMMNQFVEDKNSDKLTSKFQYKNIIFYKMYNTIIIKYDLTSGKAYFLEKNLGKWVYSEPVSLMLKNNKNNLERLYYFVDQYENADDVTNQDLSKGKRL